MSHFHRSPLATSGLRKLIANYQLTFTELILDCKTRWNSTHDMLARNLALMMPITDQLIAEGKDDLALTADEWVMTRKIVNVLEPFKRVSQMYMNDY